MTVTSAVDELMRSVAPKVPDSAVEMSRVALTNMPEASARTAGVRARRVAGPPVKFSVLPRRSGCASYFSSSRCRFSSVLPTVGAANSGESAAAARQAPGQKNGVGSGKGGGDET